MYVGNSPRFPTSVFAIFDNDKPEAVGTCFAISDTLLLSCQHFMNGNVKKYRIALTAQKSDGVVHFTGERNVIVLRYNREMDYALLGLSDEPHNLDPIPLSLHPVEADIDVKVFHFPVTTFNDSANGSISPFTAWVKTSIATRHHLPCGGPGLYKGSSGAPYVLRSGGAVALHMEAVNDAKTVDFEDDANADAKLEVLSSTVNSNANSHGSISSGLLIGQCPKLVAILKEFDVATGST